MILYLARHGQTEWNLLGRVQGQTDTFLTDVGREQAEALSEYFKEKPVSGIFASDLKRAKDTAAIVAASKKITVQTNSLLRESRYGTLEGKQVSDYSAFFFPQNAADIVTPCNQIEDETATALRFQAGLEKIPGQHAHCLVVSHGGAILAFLKNKFREQCSQCTLHDIPNASIWKLSYVDGNYHLLEQSKCPDVKTVV